MKFFIIFISALCISFNLDAQFNLAIRVNNFPSSKKGEPVFIAGNFNNWQPGDSSYLLKAGEDYRSINLRNIPAGIYEFKFTRGSWDKAESSSTGNDISNRVLVLRKDTTIELNIQGWKDDFAPTPRKHTASANVRILDTAFSMPQLQRNRRIWIYLPPSYANSGKSYPVLYMHDGQNLFDEYTSAFGEWGIDEAMDSLQLQTGKEIIVVGIDHGGEKRMSEYNPYNHDKFGAGAGKLYVDFLVQTLKPYIDSKFRTNTTGRYTYIAGSSMGGLISLYAIMQYPNIFSRAGIFSPAFWTAPQLKQEIDKTKKNTFRNHHMFFYAGEKESSTMVPDMLKISRQIKKARIKTLIDPEGMHNEPTWRKYFPMFYRFLAED